MKWLRTLVIFDRGNVVSSSDWKTIHDSYIRSIQNIDFPKGSGTLTLRRKQLRENGQWDRNGVGYLRKRFLDHMVDEESWKKEAGFDLGEGRKPAAIHLYPSMDEYEEPITSEFGGFDFVTTAPSGTHVAIEWETGNISSSHRSLNKLMIALRTGHIQAGVLIVPSRQLYQHLTDRIGNIGELSGYISLWKDLADVVERGLLAVSVVEQDHLTDDPVFEYLPAGEDGRSRQGRAKRKKKPARKKRKVRLKTT